MGENIKTGKVENILLLTADFPPARGGIAKASSNLLKLVQRRYNVKTLVFNIEGRSRDNTEYIQAGILKIPPIISQYLKNNNVDMIMVMTIFPLGWILPYVSSGIPSVYFIYGSELIEKNRYKLRPSHNIILKNAYRTIAISRFTASLVKTDADIFYPLIDSGQYNTSMDRKHKDYFTIGSIGRIVRHKNYRAVLECMASISRRVESATGKSVKYQIAGTGPGLTDLQDIIDRNELGEHAEILGNIDDSQRDRFYSSIDVLAVPSITTDRAVEGFGLVVQEAGLFGVPSAGFSSGGLAESIEDSELLADEGDQKGIEDIIVKLLTDNQFYNKKSGEALSRTDKYKISDIRLDDLERILGIGSGGRI